MASANDIKMRILAEDKTAAAFRSAKKNIDSTTKSVRLLKAAVSIGAIVAFTNMARRTAETADQIAKFSQRIGINAQALQELQFAATQSGIKVEAFNMGMQRFTRRAAEAAEGTGEAKAALKELGVQLTDSNGNLRPAEALLGDVAEAFKDIEDPAQRVRLAFKLFDSEGVAMLQMLGDGKAAMEGMRREARDLGLVLSEDTLKNAEKVANQFDIMSRIIDSNLTEAMVNIAPVLVAFTNGIKVVTKELKEFFNRYADINQMSLQTVVDEINRLVKKREELKDLAGYIDDLGGSSDGVTNQVKKINEQIAELQERSKQLTIQGHKLTNAFMPDINLEGKKNTGKPSFFDDFTSGAKKGFGDYKDALNDTMEATRKATQNAFKGMEDALVTFVQTGKLNFRDLANSIVADLIRIQIRAAMSNVFSAIGGDLFGSLFSSTPTTAMAGTRASGGPVGAGRSYLVGENGPELLTMGSSSGYVTPSAASAGGPITINYNIQSWDSRDTMSAIQQSAPQIVGIVQQAFNKRGRRGPMG